MKKMIIASTSTVHGSEYLEYILPTLSNFFNGVESILFIPYARPGGLSYDGYTKNARNVFKKIDLPVKGIHEFDDPKLAIKNAKAIFTGGGNTFELVNQLHKNNLLDVLKEVLLQGVPYLGTSAGSNICGVNMMNTNDMPIVYPPSFNTLGMIPFNINAHYLDPNSDSTHMGETRETRIKEFHVFNDLSVLGLREGSWLEVTGEKITLRGNLTGRWFQKDKKPIEIETNNLVNDFIN